MTTPRVKFELAIAQQQNVRPFPKFPHRITSFKSSLSPNSFYGITLEHVGDGCVLLKACWYGYLLELVDVGKSLTATSFLLPYQKNFDEPNKPLTTVHCYPGQQLLTAAQVEKHQAAFEKLDRNKNFGQHFKATRSAYFENPKQFKIVGASINMSSPDKEKQITIAQLEEKLKMYQDLKTGVRDSAEIKSLRRLARRRYDKQQKIDKSVITQALQNCGFWASKAHRAKCFYDNNWENAPDSYHGKAYGTDRVLENIALLFS